MFKISKDIETFKICLHLKMQIAHEEIVEVFKERCKLNVRKYF